LKPGMNATCDFVTARKSDVLTVPNAAVKNAGGQTRVLVAVNGKPVPREVQVGLSDNDNTEIVSGLQEGDVVVTAVNDPRKQATTGSTQGSSSGRSGSGGMRRMGGPGGMPPGP
ncbi:MAG TPA: RND transporter, partial [Armatimonadota bacterium]|nr:RND transporter [Armatimonadota bacterium]